MRNVSVGQLTPCHVTTQLSRTLYYVLQQQNKWSYNTALRRHIRQLIILNKYTRFNDQMKSSTQAIITNELLNIHNENERPNPDEQQCSHTGHSRLTSHANDTDQNCDWKWSVLFAYHRTLIPESLVATKHHQQLSCQSLLRDRIRYFCLKISFSLASLQCTIFQ